MTDDSRIQIYQSPDGETQVDVRFEHETVWLTQAQMGQVSRITIMTQQTTQIPAKENASCLNGKYNVQLINF